MSPNETTSDSLTGTVKGPGERPHEYLFITADQLRARIGEFVYYVAHDGREERRIIGNVTSRRLVRNLPDSFSPTPRRRPRSSPRSSASTARAASCTKSRSSPSATSARVSATSSTRASRRGPATRSSSPPPRRSRACSRPDAPGERGSAHVGSLLRAARARCPSCSRRATWSPRTSPSSPRRARASPTRRACSSKS